MTKKEINSTLLEKEKMDNAFTKMMLGQKRIKEAYCSHEVSELLKEKGFDEECTHYYSYEDDELIEYTNGVCLRNSKDYRCASPTHQMAIAWLREVHKIHIVISPISGKGYGAILCDVGDFDDFNYIGETDYFFHPEEAVEAGLKYSLETLI